MALPETIMRLVYDFLPLLRWIDAQLGPLEEHLPDTFPNEWLPRYL